MKALILAGGQAERMGGYSKPLVFVAGYTILERAIAWLKEGGFEPEDILLAYGDRRELQMYAKRFVPVENLLDDGGKPLGDGGAIRRAMEEYGIDSNYLVMNGDVLPLFGARAFIRFCKSLSSEYIGAVVAKKMRSRYGLFELSENGSIILSLKEKPEIGLGSCGIYFLRGATYELLPHEGGFAAAVLTEHYGRFCPYVIQDDEWVAVETVKDVVLAERLLHDRGG